MAMVIFGILVALMMIVAAENNSTTLSPMPIDLLAPFVRKDPKEA